MDELFNKYSSSKGLIDPLSEWHCRHSDNSGELLEYLQILHFHGPSGSCDLPHFWQEFADNGISFSQKMQFLI